MPGDVGRVSKIDVREIIGRQMLAFVVLQSLREPESRVAEAHEWAVVAAARTAIEAEDGKSPERRIVGRRQAPAYRASSRRVVVGSAPEGSAGQSTIRVFHNIAYDVVGEGSDDLNRLRAALRGKVDQESFLFAGRATKMIGFRPCGKCFGTRAPAHYSRRTAPPSSSAPGPHRVDSNRCRAESRRAQMQNNVRPSQHLDVSGSRSQRGR